MSDEPTPEAMRAAGIAPTPPPPFTIQQAQSVMLLARAAPLRDSNEADAVRELLNAYATWVNAVVPHE